MRAPVSFGPFVFDPISASLSRDGERNTLGARAAALLDALLSANGEAVPRDALMEAVWPGTIVEENNLTVQIAGLRKLLGRRPDAQEWIVTVPRVGYRLIQRGQPAPAPPATRTMAPRIAVLPFENIGSDPEQQYLADGIADDLITALSRFRTLIVIARSSSFALRGRSIDARQAAENLGVRYILEGSVRRAADRIRITAQLVDGATAAQLWADTFDTTWAGVFDAQHRITSSVVATVVPEITRAEIVRNQRERPESVEAYDLYLRAAAHLNEMRPAARDVGLTLLDKAVTLDPTFALAMARMASAIEYGRSMGWPPTELASEKRAIDLARKAIDLAPNDANILARCGGVLVLVARDYDRGLPTAVRGAELNPNDQTALLYAGLVHLRGGSLDEAASFFGRAIDLLPRNAGFALASLGHVELCRDNEERALELAARSVALLPTNGGGYWILIAANHRLCRHDEARRILAEYRAVDPEASLTRIRANHHSREPWRMDRMIDALAAVGMPQ
jgi:TolB-like protein/tetratricopeptide (TPR) repeat protein